MSSVYQHPKAGPIDRKETKEITKNSLRHQYAFGWDGQLDYRVEMNKAEV